MKLIEAWLVMMIWLALHSSVNDRAARENETACQKNTMAAVTLGQSRRQKNTLRAAGTAWTEERESRAQSESREQSESGAQSESRTQSESSDHMGGEGETQKDTETETGESEDPGTGSGKESEGETETDGEKESEGETETDEEGEGEEITESETETESGSEEKKIRITDLRTAYEAQTRVYDGTTYIELEADAGNVPEGVELLVWGEAEAAGAGQWEVMPFFSLTGENAEEYELSVEAPNPSVTIAPRPLTIKISDARKYYFTENSLSSLEFLTGDGPPVEVAGFVEEDKRPADFCLPELTIDEEVLKKESPIYENGEQIEYEDAIVVKLDEEGRPTGNPTENYCFVLDKESGFYDPGSVYLEPSPIVGTLDYTLYPSVLGTMCYDANGTLWVRRGAVIVAEPTERCGFTEGIMTAPLYESGTVGFVLQKRSRKGEVLAKSQIQQIAFCVDGTGPDGAFLINGEKSEGNVCYSKENVTVELAALGDGQSGLRSVRMYADSGNQGMPEDASAVYESTAGQWTERRGLTLTEEGNFCVYARLEDHVGNITYLMSPQICIDRTAPRLQILEIAPESANNGRVAPVVVCTDSNYEEGSLEVTLSGSRVGEKAFAQEREAEQNKETVKILDIPREKRWDDLYVLRAGARDRAGNYSEKSIVFSVNRFGSVFKVEHEVQKKLDQYYLQEPVDLVVREFNVDTVSRSRIYIGSGEKLRALKEGVDYEVARSSAGEGWREYRYFIPAANFEQEGIYYVVIATKDRAGNASDNRLQKQNLEFVIDRSSPSIIITGIKNGESFPESRTVEIECRDNISLARTEIYLNDIAAVQNCEENQQFTLFPAEGWQKLEVRAADRAGNVSRSDEIWAYLGSNGEIAAKAPEAAVKKEKEKTEYHETLTDSGRSTEKNAGAYPGEAADVKKTDEWLRMLAGTVFFSILGVYFYKNKRVK